MSVRKLGCAALLIAVCFRMSCSASDAKPAAPPKSLEKGWRIRGAHNGRSNDFTMLSEMSRTGMNSIMVSIGGHMVGSDGKPTYRLEGTPQLRTLNEWQKATLENGMMYFPMIELFGTGDQKRWPLKRFYVYPDGTKTNHMPCPGDADFWNRKFTHAYVQIARWAKDKPNIPGIVVDTEMYGADKVAFNDACFCPHCRKEIAAELGILPEAVDSSDKEMLKRYRDAFTNRLIPIFEQTRIRVHEVYPECLLGAYLLDHLSRTPDGEEFVPPVYRAMTMAWGTLQAPVLVFSEATYQPGYHTAYGSPERPLIRRTGSYVKGQLKTFGMGDHPDYIETWLKRWKDWGASAEFVGGLWLNRIPDENIAENIYHMAKNTRGYWFYDVCHLGSAPPGKMPGGGTKAYWQAIGDGNKELDKWLQSNGSYQSPLRVRPYTTPPPGVSLEKWKAVELPLIEGPAERSAVFFRSKEALFYIPAKAGDKVRLIVLADSLHPYKKKEDVLAIVVVDPDGKVITRDKMMSKDLGKEPWADHRWGGKRTVEFEAKHTGTYGVFLNAQRYGYTLGDCSHQWLAAASTWPAPGVRLFNPKEVFVKTLPGAKEAKLNFGDGGNTAVLDVYDAQGVKLTRQNIGTDGGSATIPLPSAKAQVLRITFEGGLVMQLHSLRGLEPYLASSPNAPFPH